VKRIIIVEIVFIQLCYKVSLTQNVCLGFMNLDEKEPCKNGLFVNSQKFVNSPRSYSRNAQEGS
jgi:hypothetical protein